MIIRRYRTGEEEDLWNLYYFTTRLIVARDYTTAQIERWAPYDMDMVEWSSRLSARNPFVADNDGLIVAFAELEPDGHIDYFYCHHLWQHKGVGRTLYAALENEARRLHIKTLRSEVSVTAKQFFETMGFSVILEQSNLVCGSVARNYVMEKQLD
jgi:putative acetyltransferase